MATATIVSQGANRLRYLLAAAGTGSETLNITTIGGATPDTLTDSIASGVIKKLSKCFANGYGAFAAGVQTSAKAKALWDSDLSGADPSSGSPNGAKLPTAKLHVTGRTGEGICTVVPDVDGGTGAPLLAVTIQGGGTFYLDIEAPNTIGA